MGVRTPRPNLHVSPEHKPTHLPTVQPAHCHRADTCPATTSSLKPKPAHVQEADTCRTPKLKPLHQFQALACTWHGGAAALTGEDRSQKQVATGHHSEGFNNLWSSITVCFVSSVQIQPKNHYAKSMFANTYAAKSMLGLALCTFQGSSYSIKLIM